MQINDKETILFSSYMLYGIGVYNITDIKNTYEIKFILTDGGGGVTLSKIN